MSEQDDLGKKIAKAKESRDASPENFKHKLEQSDKDASLAGKLAFELLAGIIVGGILGYFLDSVFHTKPILLIVFLLLGAISAFWNIYKLAIKE